MTVETVTAGAVTIGAVTVRIVTARAVTVRGCDSRGSARTVPSPAGSGCSGPGAAGCSVRLSVPGTPRLFLPSCASTCCCPELLVPGQWPGGLDGGAGGVWTLRLDGERLGWAV